MLFVITFLISNNYRYHHRHHFRRYNLFKLILLRLKILPNIFLLLSLQPPYHYKFACQHSQCQEALFKPYETVDHHILDRRMTSKWCRQTQRVPWLLKLGPCTNPSPGSNWDSICRYRISLAGSRRCWRREWPDRIEEV